MPQTFSPKPRTVLDPQVPAENQFFSYVTWPPKSLRKTPAPAVGLGSRDSLSLGESRIRSTSGMLQAPEHPGYHDLSGHERLQRNRPRFVPPSYARP